MTSKRNAHGTQERGKPRLLSKSKKGTRPSNLASFGDAYMKSYKWQDDAERELVRVHVVRLVRLLECADDSLWELPAVAARRRNANGP